MSSEHWLAGSFLGRRGRIVWVKTKHEAVGNGDLRVAFLDLSFSSFVFPCHSMILSHWVQLDGWWLWGSTTWELSHVLG